MDDDVWVGGSLVGLSPYLVRSVRTLVSVRTELNCRMPNWCQRVGQCGVKAIHLVPEALCE